MKAWPLPPDATYAQVRAWLRVVDPELDAACDEVDSTLSEDTLRLSPRERLDRASAATRWLGAFTREAR